MLNFYTDEFIFQESRNANKTIHTLINTFAAIGDAGVTTWFVLRSDGDAGVP